jgi:hypothetical protein
VSTKDTAIRATSGTSTSRSAGTLGSVPCTPRASTPQSRGVVRAADRPDLGRHGNPRPARQRPAGRSPGRHRRAAVVGPPGPRRGGRPPGRGGLAPGGTAGWAWTDGPGLASAAAMLELEGGSVVGWAEACAAPAPRPPGPATGPVRQLESRRRPPSGRSVCFGWHRDTGEPSSQLILQPPSANRSRTW